MIRFAIGLDLPVRVPATAGVPREELSAWAEMRQRSAKRVCARARHDLHTRVRMEGATRAWATMMDAHNDGGW